MFSEIFKTIAEQGLNIAFANPSVWWLLPLPIAVYFLTTVYREHSESVEIASLTTLTAEKKSMGEQKQNHSSTRAYILIGLIWFGLLAAASRPEQINIRGQQEVSVRDILLVLDISGSMAIRDMQGENGEPASASRMQVMQAAVSEFIDKRTYDNIGLIVFGSQALPLSPVSQDHVALSNQISEMVPGMAGPQTSMGDAMGVAIRTYRDMNQHVPDAENDAVEKERTMILLTDGLDTSSVLPPRIALRLAQKQNITIHTIAFGDVDAEDGGTSVDLELLRDIAEQTSGSFHQASESLASLQKVYDAIDRLTPKKVTLVGITERLPLFTFPLFLSLALSIIVLILTQLPGKEND